jgi:hypothetical protein
MARRARCIQVGCNSVRPRATGVPHQRCVSLCRQQPTQQSLPRSGSVTHLLARAAAHTTRHSMTRTLNKRTDRSYKLARSVRLTELERAYEHVCPSGARRNTHLGLGTRIKARVSDATSLRASHSLNLAESGPKDHSTERSRPSRKDRTDHRDHIRTVTVTVTVTVTLVLWLGHRPAAGR